MQRFEFDQLVYVTLESYDLNSISKVVRPAFSTEVDNRVFAVGRYCGYSGGDMYQHRVAFPGCDGESEVFRDVEVSTTRPAKMVVDYAVTDEGVVV